MEHTLAQPAMLPQVPSHSMQNSSSQLTFLPWRRASFTSSWALRTSICQAAAHTHLAAASSSATSSSAAGAAGCQLAGSREDSRGWARWLGLAAACAAGWAWLAAALVSAAEATRLGLALAVVSSGLMVRRSCNPRDCVRHRQAGRPAAAARETCAVGVDSMAATRVQGQERWEV